MDEVTYSQYEFAGSVAPTESKGDHVILSLSRQSHIAVPDNHHQTGRSNDLLFSDVVSATLSSINICHKKGVIKI